MSAAPREDAQHGACLMPKVCGSGCSGQIQGLPDSVRALVGLVCLESLHTSRQSVTYAVKSQSSDWPKVPGSVNPVGEAFSERVHVMGHSSAVSQFLLAAFKLARSHAHIQTRLGLLHTPSAYPIPGPRDVGAERLYRTAQSIGLGHLHLHRCKTCACRT